VSQNGFEKIIVEDDIAIPQCFLWHHSNSS
jgi:hypothetical protein